MKKLSAILTLTRPLSNAKNVVFILFAYIASRGDIDGKDSLLIFLALSCVSSAIYAYNAVSDKIVDERNSEKSVRPFAVKRIGESRVLLLALALFILGVIIASTVTFLASIFVMLLGVVGYLYSSSAFRLKERPVADVVFGAVLPHTLRFVAVWAGLLSGAPPLLPAVFFSYAKTGGYILYKEFDRADLTALGFRNTITLLSPKITFSLSAVSFLVAASAFVGMTLTGPREPWGFALLPRELLLFLPLGAIPLSILFARAAGVIGWRNSTLRVIGLLGLLVFLGAIFILES